MALVEGEKVSGTSTLGAGTVGYKGTEGLFAAIEERGNKVNNFSGAQPNSLADFDSILKNLDTQGAIEENMLFVNRGLALEIDDMLGDLSSGADGGTAYGLFENSEEMALNLGFSGFRLQFLVLKEFLFLLVHQLFTIRFLELTSVVHSFTYVIVLHKPMTDV
jgi:hypothetical protein